MLSMKNILLFFVLTLGFSPLAFSKEKAGIISSYGAYVAEVLAGSLDAKGLSVRAFMDPNLPTWETIGKEIDFDISIQNCFDIDCGGNGHYDRDLAFISATHNSRADRVTLLPNKKSYQTRAKLFSEARESIFIMVWSLYDDETGEEFVQQMLDAIERNPQMDVRLIVDGNVASLGGHRKLLKELETRSEGKIKVMRWKTDKYRANGTHRKMIIVDKHSVIVGGMNIGNAYANREGAPQWRDLDVLMEGDSIGLTSFNQFVSVWNSHDSKDPKQQYSLMAPVEIDEENLTHGMPVIAMDQHPGSIKKRAHLGVHTAVVKLLRNATQAVDIENAYFILDPVLEKELKKAVKRGVRVRIFTNSRKSIDMAVITNPLLLSAKKAASWGAEVYLKKGATLHGKYLVVDNKISMIGSFNFHPRSLRFDGENAAVIIDDAFADELTTYFEDGINYQAKKIEAPAMFKIGFNLLASFTQFFYFDFL
jgi:phosphatidylserine/phosphatidylglycerophosphate/cardiolipin synthase-like enzyme